MYRFRKLIVVLVLSLIPLSAFADSSAARKVIIDSDMVEGFDDGIAMLLLENSPQIDLLGITIVSGNATMPDGVSAAVRQFEAIGSDTPVYEGARMGLRVYRNDHDFLDAEELFSPNISWPGYLRYVRESELYSGTMYDPMSDWHDLYELKYGSSSDYEHVYGLSHPDSEGNRDAVDFLISMANKYPGEITIVAIGPCTNLALAILEDPTFPSKIKQIVYMGGAFYMEGNASAVAEFNWWADPDAARMCIRAIWGDEDSGSYSSYGNQVISGLEASELAGGVPQDIYDSILRDTYPGIRELLLNKYGTEAPTHIWDVLAAAYVVDPSIVLSWNNHEVPASGSEDIFGVYIDVDSEMGPGYGRAVVYPEKYAPQGLRKAAIQNQVDADRIWNEIVYPALKDSSAAL